MGIHGLTGFIDNNQHVLHQHQLHDCSVVLDGNNFFHFLYYACHVRCGFGGDYDIYRKKIISTFDSFKICGVTPYVVMDGAYTVDGRKLRTSLSRASARIRLVDVMANHQRGQAMPILAYETFMQTLDELGIRHITCQFEADNEIAVLANKLRCPVISNDSDFYIFDLNSGFLPLDYLDFRLLENQTSDGTTLFHYLHCYKYHVDDFINSFDGLNRSVLPVFASLLGNDFINPSAFSTFYSRIKAPKIISKKFSLPPRLSKVISVLHWLHSKNDSTEFLDIKRELLEFIKPRRKELVERLFVSSVNGYVDVENFQGFDLFNFVTVGPGECQLTAAEDFRSYGGKVFPDWFIKAVCCGEITPSILNCAILHRVIILAQVEDLSQASSYLCSLSLRRIIYGILFQDQGIHTMNKEHAEADKMSEECLHGDKMSEDCILEDKISEDLHVDKMSEECLHGDKMSDDCLHRDKMSQECLHSKMSQECLHRDKMSQECLRRDKMSQECLHRDTFSQECLLGDKMCEECLHGCLSHEKSSVEKMEQELLSDIHPSEEENIVKGDGAGDAGRGEKEDCLIDDESSDVKGDGADDAGRGEKEDCLIDDESSDVKICENDITVSGVNTVGGRKRVKDSCVEEYTRINKNLLKSFVQPLLTIGNVSVPSLTSLTTMSLDNRRFILTESLGVDEVFMGRFSEDLQLFAACIVMWSRNASPKITLGHLDSVIVGVIVIRIMASLAGKNGDLKEKGDKSGRKGELKEKVNDDMSGRECEVKEKGGDTLTNKKMNELGDGRKEPKMKDSDDISEINVEPKKNLKTKYELKETDISEVCKLSSLAVDDSSTTLFEMTTQTSVMNAPLKKIKHNSIPLDIGMICSEAAIHDLENGRQNLSKYHMKGPTFNHNNHFNPKICHGFAQLQACILDAINLNKLLRFPFRNIRPADLINGTFLYNFYVDISTRANSDLFLATMLGKKSDLFSTFELFRNIIIDFVGEDNFVSQASLTKKSRKRKSKVKEKDLVSNDVKMENCEDKEVSVKTISGFNVTNMFSVLCLED